MKCPSCSSPLPAPMPECPWCGLTIEKLDTKFGAIPRHMLFFTDRSSSLPLRGMEEVRDQLETFNRKFPQSVFSALVVPEIKNGTIAEYTFWLANRARFNTDDVLGADNFDLLLGIDLGARAAALIVGYGLENYLTEDDLNNALGRAAERFRAKDIIAGVRNCIDSVSQRMQDIVLTMEQERMLKAQSASATNE